MARSSNLHWMYEVCVCFVNWFATYGVLLWLAWAWVIVQGCCCSSKGSLFAVFFHSGSRKSAVKYSAVSLFHSHHFSLSLPLPLSIIISPCRSVSIPAGSKCTTENRMLSVMVLYKSALWCIQLQNATRALSYIYDIVVWNVQPIANSFKFPLTAN